MRELLANEVMRVMELTAIDNETVLDMDSLSRTEIAFFAEEQFGLQLTDQEIKSAKTFQDLEAILAAK